MFSCSQQSSLVQIHCIGHGRLDLEKIQRPYPRDKAAALIRLGALGLINSRSGQICTLASSLLNDFEGYYGSSLHLAELKGSVAPFNWRSLKRPIRALLHIHNTNRPYWHSRLYFNPRHSDEASLSSEFARQMKSALRLVSKQHSMLYPWQWIESMLTIQKSNVISSRPKPTHEMLSGFLDSKSGLGFDDEVFPFDAWDQERGLFSGLRDPYSLLYATDEDSKSCRF